MTMRLKKQKLLFGFERYNLEILCLPNISNCIRVDCELTASETKLS